MGQYFVYILFPTFLHAHFFDWPIKLYVYELIYINIQNMSSGATQMGTWRTGEARGGISHKQASSQDYLMRGMPGGSPGVSHDGRFP